MRFPKSSVLLILSLSLSGLPHAQADKLVCCGGDEVFIMDVAVDGTRAAQKLWSWKASGRDELPESYRTLFRTTDDCKPVEGGKRILISSSGGGAALVEHPGGRVLWYGRVGGAHSIELLPHDRVVVAGSTHAAGDRVVVFDLGRPGEPLFQAELYSGHGVVWDPRRERLWALGYEELRAYRLEDWESAAPKLKQTAAYKLPTPGGHDLSPVPGADALVVTSESQVYIFDGASGTFTSHKTLGDRERVKCVTIHPKTGRTAWIQAESGEWWSPRIRFLEPFDERRLDGERLYKVRWLIEED